MKLVIAADHAGQGLKDQVKKFLLEQNHGVLDLGAEPGARVDYPDVVPAMAQALLAGTAQLGVLVCGSGTGMAMAANRWQGLRAANCVNEWQARLARAHNNANVLCLGERALGVGLMQALLETFVNTPFDGGRHVQRVGKLDAAGPSPVMPHLATVDPQVFAAITQENARQEGGLELIASENFVSPAVMEAVGSPLTNKYAEGYPGKRYYGGCEFHDVIEQLAIDRAKDLFGSDHANVQPHSGAQANMAVYMTHLNPGDTILAMNLEHGGHLTHGSPVNFSGRTYKVIPYGVRQEDGRIDYDALERLAQEHRPRFLVAGASAYPRTLDFERFGAIARSVNAKLMVDMAHIAGLVAAGLHPSPVAHADFVTTTTHKTLRGPRGGLILCRAAEQKGVDSRVFPGVQGGPLMHVIAGKAVCLKEALAPAFKTYQAQIVANAQALARTLVELGGKLASGGTDNHLMLLDVSALGATGKECELALGKAGITVNKNMIPFDTQKPAVTSGIRLGTPAVTTRGLTQPHMRLVGELVIAAIQSRNNDAALAAVKVKVEQLAKEFPLYPHLAPRGPL